MNVTLVLQLLKSGKKHKLIYTGEKLYECDERDYNTTRSGTFKTHKLIHSGEKPYKCDLFLYSIETSGALTRH